MATPLESRRIVIAGASSVLGAELKTLLEEGRFAASDFRLVDEEAVAAILTEAAGEPAVILPVEEDSFNKAWIVFFTGSPAFSQRNYALAKKSGAHIVDLSGEFAGHARAHIWLPNFDDLAGTPFKKDTFDKDASILVVPSAAAEIIARRQTASRSGRRESERRMDACANSRPGWGKEPVVDIENRRKRQAALEES